MTHSPLSVAFDNGSPKSDRPHARTHRLTRWLALALCLWAGLGMQYSSAVEVQAFPNLQLSDDSRIATLLWDTNTGRLYLGGLFDHVNGLPLSNLARFNSDGSIDSTWAPNPNGWVTGLALDNAGNLLVVGSFSSIGGEDRGTLAKVDTSGSGVADPAWAPNLDDHAILGAIVLGGDGNLYVGGDFSVAGHDIQNLARIPVHGDGAVDPLWAPNPEPYEQMFNEPQPPTVEALALDGDMLYVGGQFSGIDGQPIGRLARVSTNGDGTVDSTWAPLDSWQISGVSALAIDGAGTVYAGGGIHYSTVGVVRVLNGLGHIDETWTPRLEGSPRSVSAIVLDGAGSVYVGGRFTEISGEPRRHLAKLSVATGLPDPAWLPEPNGGISAMVLDDAGTLIVSGWFSTIGGVPRELLAGLSVIHSIPLLAPWAFAVLAAGLFGFGARRLRRAAARPLR